MMLQEAHKLNVNDRLAGYLPLDIMDGLHIYKGTDYSKEIRIKQLLQHTSGLPDYFEDIPKEGPSFMNLLFSDPEKMWRPRETVDFAKTKLTPHFPPGKGYRYSDTEYVLLGLLIEELSGEPYHQVLTEKILVPLNLQKTYMYLRSKPTDTALGRLAEVYVGDTEISSFKSLSADWAGGSLATTSRNLITFLKALNEGKLVSKESIYK